MTASYSGRSLSFNLLKKNNLFPYCLIKQRRLKLLNVKQKGSKEAEYPPAVKQPSGMCILTPPVSLIDWSQKSDQISLQESFHFNVQG